MNVEDLASLLNRSRRVGDGIYHACCPAHDDSSPSLSLRQSGDRVLVFCHAGCSFEAITNAMGIDARDWFEDENLPAQARAARADRELARAAMRNRTIATWARIRELGYELRVRDERRRVIATRVALGEMSEDDALGLLSQIYLGYNESEREWKDLISRVYAAPAAGDPLTANEESAWTRRLLTELTPQEQETTDEYDVSHGSGDGVHGAADGREEPEVRCVRDDDPG